MLSRGQFKPTGKSRVSFPPDHDYLMGNTGEHPY